MTEDLASKIINKIETDQITPIPRWRFLAHNDLFWLAYFATLLVGALTCALAIFLLTDNDWDVSYYQHHSFARFLFVGLPTIWLIFFIILVGLTIYNFKQTKRGYRSRFSHLLLISLLASLLFGGLFFVGGLGKYLDHLLDDNISVYYSSHDNKLDVLEHLSARKVLLSPY